MPGEADEPPNYHYSQQATQVYEETIMLMGIAVITISTFAVVWINDNTPWGGPEFEPAQPDQAQ